MTVVTVFHYVDWDTPGRRDGRAICGELVDRYAAHHNKPNCPTCARILAERRHNAPLTAEDVFGSEPPGRPVHSTLSDPLKDYKPKGVTR